MRHWPSACSSRTRSVRQSLPVVICFLIVTITGCEEVPSTPAPPPPSGPAVESQAPAANVNTITPTSPAQQVPGANLEDPQAVISKFMNTPTNERKDNDLLRLCSLSSGTETVSNLDLNSSPVTDAGLKNLAKLANLDTINFANTHITEVGFAVMLELPKLRNLNLTKCAITPAVLETLAKLEGLEDLTLERTSATDSALAAIENLGNLKSLNLTGTQISDNGFKHLNKMKSLEVLKISNTG